MRLSLIPSLVVLAVVGAVVGAGVAAVLAVQTDGFTQAAFWVRHVQEALQGDLVQAVKDWRATPDGASLTALVVACFLYGVFHAVGPGHGKAVLSAYAATAAVRLRQVLWLSALTAAVQATVAVVLVGAAFLVAGTGMRWVTRQATELLEPLSYGAIILVGVWLVFGALRGLVSARRDHHHHHHHDHAHDHDGHCCDHHLPAVTETPDGRSGVALALAAGLRPCTGSLLVVALSFGFGLWGLGVAASYAIGAGTAITVAVLAGGVHAVRGPVAALARVADVPAAAWRPLILTVRLIGGGLILLLGGVMLHAALTVPQHPFG